VKSATKPLGGSASLENYRAELKDRIATCYFAIGDYRTAMRYWEEALAEKAWSSSDRQAIEKDIAKAKDVLSKAR
jgi:cytochrome c-type biogenesis protein CcmH/NrfG